METSGSDRAVYAPLKGTHIDHAQAGKVPEIPGENDERVLRRDRRNRDIGKARMMTGGGSFI